MKKILLLIILISGMVKAQDFDFSCGLTELQQSNQDYFGFYEDEFNEASEEDKITFLESLEFEGSSVTSVYVDYSYNELQVHVDGSQSYTSIKRNWGYGHWKEKITFIKVYLGFLDPNAPPLPTEEEKAADIKAKAAEAIGDAYYLINTIPARTSGSYSSVDYINSLLELLNDRTCHNTRSNPGTNGDACSGSKYSGGPLTTANYFNNNQPYFTRHIEIWDGNVKIFSWRGDYDKEIWQVSNERWTQLCTDLIKLIAELNGGTTGNVDKDAAVKALLENIDYTTGVYNIVPKIINLFFIDIEASKLTQQEIIVSTYPSGSGLVGGSLGACYDNRINVTFGTDNWNGFFFHDYRKAWLVYHELGHDILNLDHVCGELEMMHPGGGQEGCTTAILSDDNWEAFHTGRARMISLEGQNIKTCD